MLSVIISGHGAFASGMEKAMHQVIGAQEQCVAIDFPPESTTQQLQEQFRTAMENVGTQDGLVFITDLLGGSPFRIASTLALEHGNIEVITGANLQLILEMMLERDELNITEFREQALLCGHRGMTCLFDELAKQSQTEMACEGI
ncbi:PTS sugar transporter subunit IIA [Vibrio metschnikovii]|uniref:PTS galactosamine/N-acetylgalactosamine transporter subunit IIA n=2 Tax=Unclassified Bacteria TaxID=49928 RepID=A0AAU6TN03_UNCXX|nr:MULTISPECIES: PTS galactosamine/N-acetylgalactosamine transporter subunit IIA [Vibrio]EKO3570796.1 PTS sugar transporter subunit IIA [Vibrio metschnikovii]EKO3581567.1 PTS sugar transporter subunit IIA [Vibrio metschnikovii]EKO3588007.1 PTS sugar transporter subunit IIA [Vibrio metschnikovii]EKO3627443.1 PTS sugar transporter subunit IIA [Vibrio metschnikovii]EKO3631176.1 PTS sugar transporter subunit IIA [Vibrio metschnikovii]